jgi:predicted nucleotidyltransferase
MKKINKLGRELHLIDIENELGTGSITGADVSHFREYYLRANNVSADAHVVVGVSSAPALLEASFGWPGARTVYLEGKDGADLSLLEIVLTENVDQRYGKVTIASGDGIFTEAATALINLGVEVTIFARATRLNVNLWSTHSTIRLFNAADLALAA